MFLFVGSKTSKPRIISGASDAVFSADAWSFNLISGSPTQGQNVAGRLLHPPNWDLRKDQTADGNSIQQPSSFMVATIKTMVLRPYGHFQESACPWSQHAQGVSMLKESACPTRQHVHVARSIILQVPLKIETIFFSPKIYVHTS